MPKIVVYFLALIFFISFHPSAFANTSVIINEFYALGSGDDPDWVELYNNSDSAINLEGWIIRDETDSNKITLNGYICSNSFRKFDFSNRLNNSGDKIRLFDSESTTIPKDEIAYFSNDIPQHSQGQSTSRSPDGSSNWILITSPTPSDNNSCTPQPSPTPVSTPSTSQSQSSGASPKSSPKPTASAQLSTNTSTKKTIASPKISPAVLGQSEATGGINLSSPILESSPEPAAQNEDKNSVSQKFAPIFIGSGIILIGLSIVMFLWYKRFLESYQNRKDI